MSMHDSAKRNDGGRGRAGGGKEGQPIDGSSAVADKSAVPGDGRSSGAGTSEDSRPSMGLLDRLSALTRAIESKAGAILVVYLILYAAFGVWSVRFFPFYSAPYGDEATYYNYAEHPWTLMGDFFEGYRPKEVMNPYNFRFFLTPFAVLFKLCGFTFVGARLIVFSYGLLMLWLMYLIANYMVRPLWSLMAVVLLSVSPSFLYLTHCVRPEGMMALFVMFCIWLIIRHSGGVPAKTYFLVGLTSASTLFIHYNGVIMSPMFFVLLLCYEPRGWTLRKISAFVAGGALFAAVFLLVNFLPAWETIEEFGIMPVTFVSNNKIPILTGRLTGRLLFTTDYFREYFAGRCFFERHTYLLTSLLTLPMLFGLFYRSRRREWLCGAAIGLYFVCQILIIPNFRFSYAFYVIPLVYLLTIVGLSKLPSSWDMKLIATVTIVGIIAVYGYYDSRTIRVFRLLERNNDDVRRVVRELVEAYGPPETVTVMSGQEHHYFLHDTRFRTFHSVIQTHDFGKTLDLISPDVVLLRKRDLERIETYLLQDVIRRSRVGKVSAREISELVAKGLYELQPNGDVYPRKEGVREVVAATLLDHGYEQYEPAIMSNGTPLVIFTRPRDAAVPADPSTSQRD